MAEMEENLYGDLNFDGETNNQTMEENLYGDLNFDGETNNQTNETKKQIDVLRSVKPEEADRALKKAAICLLALHPDFRLSQIEGSKNYLQGFLTDKNGELVVQLLIENGSKKTLLKVRFLPTCDERGNYLEFISEYIDVNGENTAKYTQQDIIPDYDDTSTNTNIDTDKYQTDGDPQTRVDKQTSSLSSSGAAANTALKQAAIALITQHPEYKANTSPDVCPEGFLKNKNGQLMVQMACITKDGQSKALQISGFSSSGALEFNSREFDENFQF